MGVRLLVGTAKGGFWVTSDDRRGWEVTGPFFKGWKVTAGLRLEGGGFIAAVASDVYGPAVFLSPDGGEWEQVADGPAYPDGDDHRLRQVWTRCGRCARTAERCSPACRTRACSRAGTAVGRGSRCRD